MAPPQPSGVPVSGCLVLMCGFPSSGKSAAAADLAGRLRALGSGVTVVDEPSLHLHRNAGYTNAYAEKNTRGMLKSTVERALFKHGPVVVLDSGRGGWLMIATYNPESTIFQYLSALSTRLNLGPCSCTAVRRLCTAVTTPKAAPLTM
jgi:hypothetical protein